MGEIDLVKRYRALQYEAEQAKARVADAENVLRELHANSSGQIEDPDFRHWTAVTIASYFSAQSVAPESENTDG